MKGIIIMIIRQNNVINGIMTIVFYEGNGNPESPHDIVGIQFFDKNDNPIHSIGAVSFNYDTEAEMIFDNYHHWTV